MKKSVILLAVASLLLASCKTAPSHGEFTKVADYLYEATFTDLDESCYERVDNIEAKSACSSVRNGAFHGRNLDLFYNEGAEVVVHVAASKDRYASLAVCGGSPALTPAVIESADTDEAVLAKIPFSTLDGINENHVSVNINVVPAVDRPIPTGTNPGARRMHFALTPRYILDHAESAAHAVELLKELDLHGGFGDTYGLHLMINDPKETYIVEVIDNELKYIVYGREDDSIIMTNFYCTLPEITPHGEGVERYGILKENFAEGCTEDGMAHLMQRVKYSQAYIETTDPFWYSEGYGIFPMEDGTVIDLNSSTPRDIVMQAAAPGFEAFKRHERDGEFWQTENTSVYNVDECTLLLFVQEDYEHSYRFNL